MFLCKHKRTKTLFWRVDAKLFIKRTMWLIYGSCMGCSISSGLSRRYSSTMSAIRYSHAYLGNIWIQYKLLNMVDPNREPFRSNVGLRA